MSNHTTIKKTIRLVAGVISLALSVMINAGQAISIKYAAGGSQIIITDLGVLPGGTTSAGLAINSQPIIVGLATDSNLNLQRPFWDANTGAIVGFADNFNPASTAIPEHMNESRAMGGTEVYGDNVYQGIYWNSTGQAFVLPPLAGVDPFYGALHTKAHGINSQGQLAGAGKEGGPNFYTHAALWPNKDTKAIDLGFLGQGVPLNYSEAYGVNDLSHVVGNSAIGSLNRGFLWRSGQMTDLGALSGQVVSEASAINNTGLIAGKSNFFPVVWEYDIANSNDVPTIQQLPVPAGFFSATTTAVNDPGDVVGYAGSPNIDSHAVLWRNGIAIDLGVWPGGHYSVANGINNLGQIVGTGTVAGDNLDHALMWTVDEGSPTPTPTPTPTVQVTVQSNPAGRTFSVDGTTYRSTRTFTWASGSSHTIGTTSPQNGAPSVRYVWNRWSDGGAISHTVAPTTNKTYTANFRTQYQLTMSHGTGGTVRPTSGWRNSGAAISMRAVSANGYSFTNWSGSGTGSYSGTNNPASITMGGPITERATFTHN